MEQRLRAARRWVSRSEWVIRLFRLEKSEGTATVRGLVMIQIDGLAHSQLEVALENGRMPFLRKLLNHEHYRLHQHYSGLPSSTPAVQGELFYGIKCAVPAFGFMKRETGEVVKMLDPGPVAAVEAELQTRGRPLLRGGSAYLDVFTGGAEEAHFCVASMGLGDVLRTTNPLLVGFLIVSNLYSVLRILGLLGIEIALAVVDCVRGIIAGRDLVKELKFIPTRAAITILLRELVAIGATIDVVRGLPVIHLNLLGYDEQAHRRGPASAFAHWSLKGIDDAIARIWRSAKGSARRDYDIWIYSDHGQAATVPFAKQRGGRSIDQAVADVFDYTVNGETAMGATQSEKLQRAKLLGGRRLQHVLPVDQRALPTFSQKGPVVVAMGPVGFVYHRDHLSPAERDRAARALVHSAGIPLVLATEGNDRVRAWTDRGEYTLPEQAAEIVGGDHPFLDEVADDLCALCRHPDAGNFTICGWRLDEAPLSFPIENGAHAGPGRDETGGFALLPGDTELPASRGFLRPLDLRHAALHLLGEPDDDTVVAPVEAAKTNGRLRIMTYNVHSCIGMDGKLSPERIARTIAMHAPDIVALQELDAGKTRTDGVDQAHRIAECLEMNFHFHPAIHVEEERYGDAVLTALPMRTVKAGSLPTLPAKRWREPRGALWVAIEAFGAEIQLINTHLGLSPGERRMQADALLGPDWLAHPDCREPVILCGDFNALPSAGICRRIRKRLNDAQRVADGHRPKNTFFGRLPAARIDYVFVDPMLRVEQVQVPKTQFARVASDHLPVIVDVSLRTERKAKSRDELRL